MKYFTFISGATGGIGKAFSELCAENNYNLFLTGRSEEKLSALKEKLLKISPRIEIETFACNLDNFDDRTEMFNYIENKGIVFDRLINVAGVDTQKGFLEYTREKALFQLRVNGEATIDVTKEILSHRAENLEIITISSMSGVSPMPYFAIYSATKAMLYNFFTAMHYELKKDGVKVTTVLPGGVPTRPDIINEIKTQGLWGKLTAKPASFIAKKALKAVHKNKKRCIPGFWNRFLFVLMHLAPKGIVLRYIAHRWKTHSKDAF